MMRIPRLSALGFFTLNLIKLSLFQSVHTNNFNNYMVRGCKTSELEETENLYYTLNGRRFSRTQKLLLSLFSEKSLIITLDISNGNIIALDFYYLNKKDFVEDTIHEGFIGVLPNYEGQGIATKMRQHAKAHFKKNGLSGISSRISKSNIASLKAAQKVGFIPIEEYYDNLLGEDRYYLRCDLNSTN